MSSYYGAVFDYETAQDPLTLKYAEYFSRVFPRSKWIFIVRDGRAVVHSIIKRWEEEEEEEYYSSAVFVNILYVLQSHHHHWLRTR